MRDATRAALMGIKAPENEAGRKTPTNLGKSKNRLSGRARKIACLEKKINKIFI